MWMGVVGGWVGALQRVLWAARCAAHASSPAGPRLLPTPGRGCWRARPPLAVRPPGRRPPSQLAGQCVHASAPRLVTSSPHLANPSPGCTAAAPPACCCSCACLTLPRWRTWWVGVGVGVGLCGLWVAVGGEWGGQADGQAGSQWGWRLQPTELTDTCCPPPFVAHCLPARPPCFVMGAESYVPERRPAAHRAQARDQGAGCQDDHRVLRRRRRRRGWKNTPPPPGWLEHAAGRHRQPIKSARSQGQAPAARTRRLLRRVILSVACSDTWANIILSPIVDRRANHPRLLLCSSATLLPPMPCSCSAAASSGPFCGGTSAVAAESGR